MKSREIKMGLTKKNPQMKTQCQAYPWNECWHINITGKGKGNFSVSKQIEALLEQNQKDLYQQ